MNRMIKRLLAAVLITSMLLGSNGISYAAEIADGDSIAGTEEVAQEAVDEEQVESPGDAEASEPAYEESAEEEQTQEEAGEEGQEADAQTVEEADADASEEDNAAAVEEETSETASAEEEAAESEDAAAAEAAAESEEAAEEAAASESAAASAPEEAAAPENADVAAAEMTAEEAAAAAAAAAAQAQEEVFTAGELVYHGADYDVSLVYDENAKIPATAELNVREIAKGTSEYESYLVGAEAAAGKGVAEARFFDITIVAPGTDGQQQEIQPQSQVRVNITYHKALEVAAEGEVQAMHFEDGTTDAEMVNTDTNGGSEVSEIAFDAESFSVYGIVYTVDFTYDGFIYCIEGGSSIYLSELAQILGLYETDLDKAFSVGNVSNVSFTDYDLVKIEKQADGDWLLISLAPFTSEETLTIEMNDGVTFIVDVTDAQTPTSTDLEQFLSDAVIAAPQDSDGRYIVSEGVSYSITLYFLEDSALQFDNTHELTYQLPDGILGNQQEGDISIRVKSFDGTITVVNGNHYRIDENGVLHFNWSSDPDIEKVFNTNNTAFHITFDGTFDADKTEIEFSDTIEKEITVDNNNSVSVYKVGNPVKVNNRIYYTINVQSTGHSQNVVVNDSITGDGVSLYNGDGAFEITSSKGSVVSGTPTVIGNSFSYTIPSMLDGEIVTIQYSATIDPSILEMMEGKVIATAGNSVSVKSDGDPDGDTKDITNTIDYTPTVTKSGKVIGIDGDTTTLEWTIVANPNPQVSMAGGRVTDTIKNPDIMGYSGDGIKILVQDSSGSTVRTDTVDWNQLESYSDSTWTYKIPDSDAGKLYQYTITYTTDVNTSGITVPTEVGNTVTTDGGPGGSGSATVGPDKPSITKKATKLDLANKEVTWVVTITVPKEGLTKAEVTDIYPNINKDAIHTDHSFIEPVIEESIVIDGLVPGEDYSKVFTENNAKIVFYKDGNQTPGLKAGDLPREVIITLKTRISDEWLDYVANVDKNYANHTNKVELDYGSVITAEDQILIQGEGIKKNSTVFGTREEDGVIYPVYKYWVDITGVTDTSIVINDTFDTGLLKLYIPPTSTYGNEPLYIWGGDQWTWNAKKGLEPVTYLVTPTGLEFHTSEASLPVNDQGYYPSYRLTYFLTVKDEAALKKLIGDAAVSEGGKYSITNNVEWNGKTDTSAVVYTYNGLDKEILTSDADLKNDPAVSDEIYADYRITINPGALILNDRNPLTLTDTFTNLSVLYDSIKVYRDSDEGEELSKSEYSVDFSGNTATYTLPDAAKLVIRYRARVIHSDDQTQSISISNTASMLTFSKNVTKTAEYTSTGGGTASDVAINLMKYESGDMNKRLAGAKFQLFKATKSGQEWVAGEPVKDKNNQNVVFETNSDGMITIYGKEKEDGWSLYTTPDRNGNDVMYILKEIEAPEGYMLLGYEHRFGITQDGSTDYDKYIYHSGDTMSAKNYPGTDVKVLKSWSDGNSKHSSDTVTVKLQQKIGDGDWSDTIREEVKDGEGKYSWEDTPGKTITLDATNDWEGYFNSLPLVVPDDLDSEDAEDVPVDYQVVETLINDEPVDATKVSITKEDNKYVFTITNTVEEEKGSLKIKKNVTVNGEATTGTSADGTYTFNVVGPNGYISEQKITITNGASNEVRVDNLVPGTYTVSEDTSKNPDGMALDGDNDLSITVTANNTADIPTAVFTNNIDFVDVEVDKVWMNADGTDTWPDGVTVEIQLTAGGTAVSGKTATLSADQPSHKFENLPKYKADGTTQIAYSVEEVEVAGYTSEIGDLTDGKITVTNTQETTEVEVDKKWKNADGTDTWPDGVTVQIQLTAGGTAVSGKTATLSADQPSHKFEKLPKYKADGTTEIAYSVEEVEVAGYASEIGDLSDGKITVTNTQETTEVEVDKKWKNADGTDTWPDGVTVQIQLTAGGTAVSGKTATLSKDQPSCKFEKLPKFDSNGIKIEYSVAETKVPGYSGFAEKATDDGKITITNTQGATEIEVEKKWKNADGTDDWPDGVTVQIQLTADGTAVSGKTATLSKDHPSYKFEGLPMYQADGETEIEYSVVELKVTGYTVEVSKTTTGRVTITNTQPDTKIEVEKKWLNADGTDTWPDGVTVQIQLTADGTAVGGKTATLSADQPSFTFDKLPKYKEDGTTEIAYSVEEVEVAGYASEVGDLSDGKITVTNTRKTGELEVTKTVVSPVPAEKDANYTFTVTLTNGEQKISGEYSGYYFDENGQATVTVKGNASVTIEGLPVGTTYSVVESKYDNFDTESTGEAGDINDTKTSVAAFTNTRKTGSLVVTKTVINKNSVNTGRPFGFTVTLGDNTINGKYGDITFNNGEAKFSLKDGEKAEANGLPTGVSYEVKEETAEGFTTTKTGDTGSISEKTVTAAFTNTYLAAGEVQIGARKALDGRPLEDEQFEFELFDSKGDGIDRKACDSTGAVLFNKISYTQNDMNTDEAGNLQDTEIIYTVKEVIPEGAKDNGDGTFTLNGYTYDGKAKEVKVTLHDNEDGTITAVQAPIAEELVFTNTYKAEGEIVLEAGKELLGEKALEKDQFTFELRDENGELIDSVKNDADGKVTFMAIGYTQDNIYEKDEETGAYKPREKTSYKYTIQEQIPEGAEEIDKNLYFYKGYTYDGTVHTITVELKDNGDGTIDAKVAGSEAKHGYTGVVFTNAYDAAGTMKLDAEKAFRNGTLKGGEFTFELIDADGNVLQSKTNDAAGNVSFDMIAYKLADAAKAPITYTVREVPGGRTDVKYDATVYTVTVELKDKGDGTLEVSKKISGGALKFVNEQLKVETSVTIGGKKVLEGRTLKNGEFKFVLADANGKWVDAATNDADGNFTFKPITYTLSDLNGEKTKVFTYSVWEVKGSESGITYDEKVYTVKVTVTDNGDGTMTAKADNAKSDVKFVNKTTEKKSKTSTKTSSSKGTKTGDEAPLGILFGGLGVGAVGLAVLLWNRKKKKDEE